MVLADGNGMANSRPSCAYALSLSCFLDLVGAHFLIVADDISNAHQQLIFVAFESLTTIPVATNCTKLF